jgi:hypothetical protein
MRIWLRYLVTEVKLFGKVDKLRPGLLVNVPGLIGRPLNPAFRAYMLRDSASSIRTVDLYRFVCGDCEMVASVFASAF